MRTNIVNTFFLVLLLFESVLFIPLKIHSQNRSAQFEHLVFEKGVPHNYIYTIYQDQYGFMWFGSLYGLVKYDGKQYKEYTNDPDDSLSISSDEVVAIFENSRDYIWIGTIEGGLNRFNRKTETFTHFKNNPEDSTSISDNTIWSIKKGKNDDLWIGTSNGLNILKADSISDNSSLKFKRIFYSESANDSINNMFVRSVLIDTKDRVWFGIFGQGLFYYNKQTSEIKEISKEIKNIVNIYEDHSRNLWLATWGQGLFKLVVEAGLDIDKESVRIIDYSKETDGPISDYIWSIEEDMFGNLWIGTNQGLNRYDHIKNYFILYRHSRSDPRSLSSDQIASLYEDDSGVLWIGAYQGGIDKFIPYTEKFTHIKNNPFNKNSLSQNNVKTVYQDSEGNLWIGTYGGGLNKCNINDPENQTFKVFTDKLPDLNSNIISTVCEDKRGNLWIGTYEGINYLDNHGKIIRIKKNKSDISNSFIVNTLKPDSKNNIWVGTSKSGLLKIQDYQVTQTYSHNLSDSIGISHNNVLSILEDSFGQIWVGTYNGLDKIVFNNNNPSDEIKRIIHYKHDKDNSSSISNNNIYCIFEDSKQNIWVGTSTGLNRFNHKTENFRRFTIKDGLPNNVVNGILEDKLGNLWLSTHKGLSKYNPYKQIFTNFDVQDGLQSNVFASNANCILQSGELVFGGINGVNIFDPLNIEQNYYIPPIVLTDFKKYGKSIKGLYLANSKTLYLDYEDNYFTFEFAALDYTNPEKNQYAYKLEGFDEDWVYCGNQNYAHYTNISPGTYTFKVRGSNNDALWNKEGISIALIILPPFWQTLWFKIIMVLLVIGLIYLLVRFIKKQEEKKSKIKEKIAELRMQSLRSKMNPHFIFNTINSIQYFLTCNEQRVALSYLSKFARLMRTTLEYSDKPDISIAKELEAVELYLELEKLRFENEFDYEIIVDPAIKIKESRIPNMLIQPYVENAVKHGIKVKNGKGFISVKLKKTDLGIRYSIEDNGIGISKSLAEKANHKVYRKSSGMEVTRNRLELMNSNNSKISNVEVLDLSEENPDKSGTRITVTIPILNMN